MPTHRIMDYTGHSEKVWDAADVVSTKDAMKRFADLTGKGYRAVVPGDAGEPGTIAKTFDPNADVLFIPQLQGG